MRPLPIAPLRGQMVAIDGMLPVAGHAIYSTAGYLVPRDDGRVRAGSTYERAADADVAGIIASHELAFRMQSAFPDSMSLDDEPKETL